MLGAVGVVWGTLGKLGLGVGASLGKVRFSELQGVWVSRGRLGFTGSGMASLWRLAVLQAAP